MNGTYQPRPIRAAQKIRDILTEMNNAQRLLTIRMMAVDRYLFQPDVPPQTYAEFLVRTHAPMLHEPAADDRAAGRRISS